ncbi:MAG: ROK family protein, partial [Acidobacteriota bacterium]
MPDKWTASPACILAFDVGGSHATAGLCDSDTLRVLGQASAPLRSDAQASEIIDVLYRLGCAVAGSPEKVAGAAFAVPGPFDFAAGVSSMLHKLRSLYGLDLRRALAERFGLDPGRILFLHDAAAFLMGEVAVGSAHGATRAAGIVLGTGIGSAFARDGRWVTEGDGVPAGGEIWNLPYGAGTVEDLLSTRALKREYALQAGREADVITIAQRAETDAVARRVFE